MSQNYNIVGMGAALVDTSLLVTEQQLLDLKLKKGQMSPCDLQRQQAIINRLGATERPDKASGGSAANSMVAASYCGCSTFFICKVAGDDNGAIFLEAMRAADISVNTNGQPLEGATGECLVLVTADAERTLLTHLGISNTIGLDNLHAEALDNADYVYLEGYLSTSESSREAAAALCHSARLKGVKIALSLSDPGLVEHFYQPLIAMVGGQVDLLFCNADEALEWTKKAVASKNFTRLADFASRFVVTEGSLGATVYDGSRFHHVDARPVQAVDTNGAGDLFAGAFLAAVCRGLDAVTATQYACNCASEVVTSVSSRLSRPAYRRIAKTLDQLVELHSTQAMK